MSPRRIAKLLAGFGALTLAAILLVTVLVVRYRAARGNLTNAAVGLVAGTLLHAHSFHWTQMKAGESQWVLTAKDASYAADKSGLILVNPDLTMTAKDGKKVDMSAALAKLKLDGNHIKSATMSGGLIVHYGDFVLSTEQATFLPDNDELDAPGMVDIAGQGMTVRGVGLTGHPKSETFDLHRDVTTQITPKQKGQPAKAS